MLCLLSQLVFPLGPVSLLVREGNTGEAQSKNEVLLHKLWIKGHFERSPVLSAGGCCRNPCIMSVQPAGMGSNNSSSGAFVSGAVV